LALSIVRYEMVAALHQDLQAVQRAEIDANGRQRGPVAQERIIRRNIVRETEAPVNDGSVKRSSIGTVCPEGRKLDPIH
jgi:hypothetical protein